MRTGRVVPRLRRALTPAAVVVSAALGACGSTEPVVPLALFMEGLVLDGDTLKGPFTLQNTGDQVLYLEECSGAIASDLTMAVGSAFRIVLDHRCDRPSGHGTRALAPGARADGSFVGAESDPGPWQLSAYYAFVPEPRRDGRVHSELLRASVASDPGASP